MVTLWLPYKYPGTFSLQQQYWTPHPLNVAECGNAMRYLKHLPKTPEV